jgi:hypothetical protein
MLRTVSKALLVLVYSLIYNEVAVNRSSLVKDYFSSYGLTRLEVVIAMMPKAGCCRAEDPTFFFDTEEIFYVSLHDSAAARRPHRTVYPETG